MIRMPLAVVLGFVLLQLATAAVAVFFREKRWFPAVEAQRKPHGIGHTRGHLTLLIAISIGILMIDTATVCAPGSRVGLAGAWLSQRAGCDWRTHRRHIALNRPRR